VDSPVAASKDLMEAAVAIARQAGKLTLDWFGSSELTVDLKGDGSPVTEADRAAERFIREEIERNFPGSSVVGEEEGISKGNPDLVWYVDPIDGTKGFSRGVPLFATLLAVNDEHGPAVGVVAIPGTGDVVWAGRGLGAWTDDGPAHVSATSSLRGAYVSTSSVTRWGTECFGRFVDAGVDVRGWGDGYGFFMAATGRIDAMIDLMPTSGPHPWDFAPIPVIMSEAGGRYSALDGSPSIDAPSAVASNGVLHDELLQLVNG
jgi:histidinol-phosphatase